MNTSKINLDNNIKAIPTLNTNNHTTSLATFTMSSQNLKTLSNQKNTNSRMNFKNTTITPVPERAVRDRSFESSNISPVPER